MKIILEEDVRGKGKRGQMISVADGYGSFLIKNGKASLATKGNINKWKRLHEEDLLQDSLKRKDALTYKDLIEKEVLEFKVKAKNNKIFGSITSLDVVKKLNEKFSTSISVEKKNVDVPKISVLGMYEAKVTLYKDIVAIIPIKVVE